MSNISDNHAFLGTRLSETSALASSLYVLLHKVNESDSCKMKAVVVVAVLSLVFAIGAFFISRFYEHMEPPIMMDEYWGRGEKSSDPSEIKPFTISVSNETLQDLKERLSKTRYFENLEGVEWEYGANPEYVKTLAEYWRTKFDWRKTETSINFFNHYTTIVHGINIHFMQYKPTLKKGQRAIPIILIHGWPGSFYEFLKAAHKFIAASTDDYAFEIVCPSIPGYGFSEAPHKPGFGPLSAARVFVKLMAKLGYKAYYAQGGDWGSIVATSIALVDSSHVKGLHLNMFSSPSPYGPLSFLSGYFQLPPKQWKKIFPLKDYFLRLLCESGYMHIQASKPHSVGFAVNDSPAGLVAYITEKFSTWSGCSANQSATCMEAHFTKEELLSNIMIYWVTQTMPSSMRLYKECFGSEDYLTIPRSYVKVPTGLADFPDEMFNPPISWVHHFFNVVHETEMPRGGHFAAFEQPDLFVKDICKFIEKVENQSRSKLDYLE